MPTDPDQDILDLVSAGKGEAAIKLLMQRYGKQVYRYVRAQLRSNPDLADDVHAKVFIEAHRDLERFAGRSTLRAWLFGIARHRVLDALKPPNHPSNSSIPVSELDLADSVPLPDQQLDDARLSKALVECLELLTLKVREAVTMKYQVGFTFEEIGKICGDRAGTVQARVKRALPALRECIEKRTAAKV
jgi:RNA polymerase sigma-70 factor (ECF subfamily)